MIHFFERVSSSSVVRRERESERRLHTKSDNISNEEELRHKRTQQSLKESLFLFATVVRADEYRSRVFTCASRGKSEETLEICHTFCARNLNPRRVLFFLFSNDNVLKK
jgi:hypothetical protein